MIISQNKKNFVCYIEKLFAPINNIPSSLWFISDGLTMPQLTKKRKEKNKPDFFFYKSNDSHIPNLTLVKDFH